MPVWKCHTSAEIKKQQQTNSTHLTIHIFPHILSVEFLFFLDTTSLPSPETFADWYDTLPRTVAGTVQGAPDDYMFKACLDPLMAAGVYKDAHLSRWPARARLRRARRARP